MAQGTGLTAQQKQFLDLAIREPYILKTFYLSGGTALSSWYFHHRESFDLDFFSLIPFDYERIIRWIRFQKDHIGYTHIQLDEDYGFLTVYLRYKNNEALKIDFHHYTKTKLISGIRWRELEIDSLRDIAVNKLRTIATLPRTRDYLDLYIIMTNKPVRLDRLIEDCKNKFGEEMDYIQLAKNFLKVSEYTDFPKMLIPFEGKNMYTFYENLARKLKTKILK